MPAILEATQMERGPLKSRLRYSVPAEGPPDRVLIIHFSGDYRSVPGIGDGLIDVAEFAQACPGISMPWIPKTGTFRYTVAPASGGVHLRIQFPERADAE